MIPWRVIYIKITRNNKSLGTAGSRYFGQDLSRRRRKAYYCKKNGMAYYCRQHMLVLYYHVKRPSNTYNGLSLSLQKMNHG